jgi:phage terminase large subunit-like protein
LYDPYQLVAVMQRLARAGLPVEEFPQTSANLTTIGQNLYDLVQGRNLTVYPDASIRLAVSRAIALETSRGWRITKEKSSHKVDIVISLAMAAHAAVATQHTPLVFTPEMVAQVLSWPRYRSPDMPQHLNDHGGRFQLGERLEAQLRQFGGLRDY